MTMKRIHHRRVRETFRNRLKTHSEEITGVEVGVATSIREDRFPIAVAAPMRRIIRIYLNNNTAF